MKHALAHGLLSHEVGQDTSVGSQSGNGDANVIVHSNQLLLIRRQLARGSLRQALLRHSRETTTLPSRSEGRRGCLNVSRQRQSLA
jgi:hypothetical protein